MLGSTEVQTCVPFLGGKMSHPPRLLSRFANPKIPTALIFRLVPHTSPSWCSIPKLQNKFAKQVNISATATKVDDIKLKNRDSTDQCLPPAKYSGSNYKMHSHKQKEWLWQDYKKAKANIEDIPAAKKKPENPPNKQAKHLESAVASHKHEISTLTAKNEKMIRV